MREIMTKEHDRWCEFVQLLNEISSAQDEDGEWYGRCFGAGDANGTFEAYTFTCDALRRMKNFDIVESLKWLQDNGGWCDCEILMNCDQEDEKNCFPDDEDDED